MISLFLIYCICLLFFPCQSLLGKDLFHAESSNKSSMSLNGVRGVNLQPSYYANGNPNFGWSLMEQYSSTIKLVRIEIEPSMVQQAISWIAQARSYGYQMIITYHDYTKLGSDDANELLNAAKWWQTNLNTITQGITSDITINLMNEWGSHSISSQAYATAYNSAIAALRSVYFGSVIIDIPGWGQEIIIAANASPLLHDTDIIFSAHIYPGAWNGYENRYVSAADLSVLTSTKRPCMIGEFGTVGTGNADVTAIVQQAKALDWGIAAWAWNGDGGDMNMISPSWATESTATEFVINPEYFYSVYQLLL